MSIHFLMDVHIPAALTSTLRLRGVDVLTAQMDGSRELSDEELLSRALDLGRVLVTQDRDFLRIAADCQESGGLFAGVVFIHPMRATFSQTADDLEILATCFDLVEMKNRLEFVPF